LEDNYILNDVDVDVEGKMLLEVLNSVRYKNPTPNPLPASREGAFDVPHVITKRYIRGYVKKSFNRIDCQVAIKLCTYFDTSMGEMFVIKEV
jgi:hypothetical protein